jgi:hypothetical protein
VAAEGKNTLPEGQTSGGEYGTIDVQAALGSPQNPRGYKLMDESVEPHRISRRKALGTIGAGVAVAWTAPAVVSFAASATAGSLVGCSGNCAPYACASLKGQCNTPHPPAGGFPQCFCSGDVGGNCFCWNDGFCSNAPVCTANSQCPATWGCVFNCCASGTPGEGNCFPPCGTAAAPIGKAAVSGRTGSGR